MDDKYFDQEIREKAARMVAERNAETHRAGEDREAEKPKDLAEALRRIRRKPDIPAEPGESAYDVLYRVLSEMDEDALNTTIDLQAAREKVLDQLPADIQEQHELYNAALAQVVEERGAKDAQETDELLDRAVQWLQNKWGEQPCPYCQHIEWQVGTPLEVAVGEDEVMSPAFPVMCGNCGHTTFVNAIRAGLIPDDETE